MNHTCVLVHCDSCIHICARFYARSIHELSCSSWKAMLGACNELKATHMYAFYVCVSVCTCVCRSLSAPAAGSSSWPCTRPLSASVPPQCRSVWVGVCICSQGSAPGAACSAGPVLHSTAASPGWTCPSTWSLRPRPGRQRTQGRSIKTHIFNSLDLEFKSII